jgi:hypothetical protein
MRITIFRVSAFYAFLILSGISAFGQHRINGKITTKTGEPVVAAVSLYSSDTLVIATTADAQGLFEFVELKKGNYLLTISDTTFRTASDSIALYSDLNRRYVLEEQITLDEVTVVADKGNLVYQTANGTVFHLSESAKKASNAFEALSEIPLLMVDETNRKIQMNSGVTPLILINGAPRKNGIRGIDPENIESVEITTVPSARYLANGVTAVVNVYAKRKQQPYRSLYTFAKQSVLPVTFGVGNFDIQSGNAKRLVYLSGQYYHFIDDERRIQFSQQNSGYSKNSESTQLYNLNGYYVCLGGDYVFSTNDYLSYSVTYMSNPSSTKQNGSGEYAFGDARSIVDISTNSAVDYYVNTYNAYYHHYFSNKSKLETTFHLNFNGNQTEGETLETYGNLPQYYYLYDYNNFRTSSSFELNYAFEWLGQSSNVGSNTSFRRDKINHISLPVYNYRETYEYLYLDATKWLSKHFSYTASVGADLIFNRSGNRSNRYYSPVASAAITCRLDPSRNSMRLSYLKNNESPDIRYMNPYNTSSDSLHISVGNPDLLPVSKQSFTYEYTHSGDGIYFSPQVSYRIISDYIVPVGNNRGNVYTQTYRNDEHFSEIDGKIAWRYRTGKRIAVSIGGAAGYRHDYFSNIDKGTFYGNLNFNVGYKKVFVSGFVWYEQYFFTPLLTTKRNAPTESEINFNWRPNKTVSLHAGMKHFFGGLKSETYQNDNGYRMNITEKMLDQRYLVMLGLTINTKNKTPKGRQEKRIQVKESGIQLVN